LLLRLMSNYLMKNKSRHNKVSKPVCCIPPNTEHLIASDFSDKDYFKFE